MSEETDFECYAQGLCMASVCTSLSDEEAERRMNLRHPTGIGANWRLSDSKEFADGTPMPCRCEDKPETHRHLLFEC